MAHIKALDMYLLEAPVSNKMSSFPPPSNSPSVCLEA